MHKVLEVRRLTLLFRSDGGGNALENLGGGASEVADQVGSGLAERLSNVGQRFQRGVGYVHLHLEELAESFGKGVDGTCDIDVCSV